MSTRMLLIRTCYIYIMANLHLTSDLVQDIEVERALKYLNWEKKGDTMTKKFNVEGH